MILDNNFSDRSPSVHNDDDIILDIIGNNTRRRILATLAREPMYFNQLAKEIAIGQQAILRHMKTLEDIGLIESYGEKSNLGAPDRKYYRLSSSFSLTICLSEDAFSIKNHKIEQYRHKESDEFYKEYDLLAQDNDRRMLNQLQNSLIRIEKEISNLDSRLNDLRALKQLIVSRLHKIAKDNFEEEFERRILHTIIGESPKSVSELANRLDEKPSRIRNSLNEMNKKIYKNDYKHRTLFLGIRET
jgi:ArsR family transcriptional regulator